MREQPQRRCMKKKLDFTEFITKVNAIFGYPALEIKLAEYVLFDLL